MKYTMILILMFTGVLMLYAAETYEDKWSQVDRFNRDQMPRSAVRVIEEIIEMARDRGDDPQLARAILERVRHIEYTAAQNKGEPQQADETRDINTAITFLDEQIARSDGVLKAVLLSSRGTLILRGTNTQIRGFGETESQTLEESNDDINTWDSQRVLREVAGNYLASLEEAALLQEAPLGEWTTVVRWDKDFNRYRPTMYDMLAHRAIDFFQTHDDGFRQPLERFRVDSSMMTDHQTYLGMRLPEADNLNFQLETLRLYRNLLRVNQDDPVPLYQVEMERLGFLRDQLSKKDIDSQYLAILEQYRERLDADTGSAETFRVTQSAEALVRVTSEIAAYHIARAENDKDRDGYRIAHEILTDAVERYPNADWASQCQNQINQIEKPVLSIVTEDRVIPGAPVPALVRFRNVKNARIDFYYLKADDQKSIRAFYPGYFNLDRFQNDFPNLDPVMTKSLQLPDTGDFMQDSAEILLPELGAGLWALLLHPEDDAWYKHEPGFSLVQATRFSVNKRQGGNDWAITDAVTGKPLKDMNITLHELYDTRGKHDWEYSWTQVPVDWIVDDVGITHLSFRAERDKSLQGAMYEFSHGKDRYFHPAGQLFYPDTPESKPQRKAWLYTDRSIYRPGQQIRFSGVMIDYLDEWTHKLVTDETELEVVLYDPNRQKAGSLTLSTDEFGAFRSSFPIPQGVRTGRWQIQTKYGSASIQIEEYKRPRFTVKMESPNKAYRLGETVEVHGNATALAGYGLDGATVRWRVERTRYWRERFWWGWMPWQPADPQEIAGGEMNTDDDGGFDITFDLWADDAGDDEYYMFTVHADVIDTNGETRSGSVSVNAGRKALRLDLMLPQKLDRDTATQNVPLTATNLSGLPIETRGSYRIERLTPPRRVLRERLWVAPDTMLVSREEFSKACPTDPWMDENDPDTWPAVKSVREGTFDTAESSMLKLPDLEDWEPGVYRVILKAKDPYGEMVTETRLTEVYSTDDQEMPRPVPFWAETTHTTTKPGDEVILSFGTGYDRAELYYRIDGSLTEGKTLRKHIGPELFTIPIEIEEEHRGGIRVHYLCIRDNRNYEGHLDINVPWDNKKLNVRTETFRSNLLPGVTEEWRFIIESPNGEPADALMAATMYDAALDEFLPHDWQTPDLYRQFRRSFGWFKGPLSRGASVRDCRVPFPGVRRADGIQYPMFREDWLPIGMLYGGFGYYRRDSFNVAAAPMDTDGAMFTEAHAPDGFSEFEAELDSSVPGRGKAKGVDEASRVKPTVQPRRNLQETAFFRPNLRTGEKGEIIISFNTPEALTRWKLLALAYDRDLRFGRLEEFATTSKPLMVVPNPPRFLREGDVIQFPARVVNKSDQPVTGSVNLELFDAETMRPVDTAFDNAPALMRMSLEPGKSTAYRWPLRIPEGIGAVVWRVTARTEEHSDGEESLLPVLSNRMLVTETLPMNVPGGQTRRFEMEKLQNASRSSSIRHHRLTLEFTSNPAWYAVQALPYLMEYPHECTEQIFSRWYANKLAQHIAESDPRIRRVFDLWRDTPDSQALLSALEKNPELKSIMLQQTPWLLEAKNESQQKRNLGVLFDADRLNRELDAAMEKLARMQMPSGAWPWFSKMNESVWVTTTIVEGIGHLKHVGVDADDFEDMTTRSLHWLDKEALERYHNILKQTEKPEERHLRYIDLQYLYARSFFPDARLDDDTAFNYYLNQAETYWNEFNRRGQGMIALILHRIGRTETARQILDSLRERAFVHDELGMYWDDGARGWFWYQAPVETQALMIEAFSEIAGNQDEIDQMRVWLLKQKQTQSWSTTRATADACYALLLQGSDWLSDTRDVQIELGDITVDPRSGDGALPEAGTGWFKRSWNGDEIEPEMASVEVRNPNTGIAWGGLYWQYFEDMDKITSHQTPLSLEKTFLVEEDSPTGPVRKPLGVRQSLRVGDRVIVRLVLRVDREMEYIHIKDLRGAGFEPENVLSGYRWEGGLGYYESTRDAASHFFLDRLPKGTHVFEYPLRVFQAGEFSCGIATIQCMYAPEFSAHSEGFRVRVE